MMFGNICPIWHQLKTLSPSCSLQHAALQLHQWCIIYSLLCSHPNKLSYDVTFDHKFLYSKQMTDCEQIKVLAMVVACFSNLGLRRM